ncbi:MAG: hypothetical protein ACRDH2_20910, partial [Anaerolineales bacterium]
MRGILRTYTLTHFDEDSMAGNGKKASDAVILSGARTPIGKFMGALSGVPAPRLGAVAIRAAVARARVRPEEVEEVMM